MNARLHFREKLVIDTNIAVWRATDHHLLLFKLAAEQIRLVALAHGEDSQFQFRRGLWLLLILIDSW